MPNMGDCLFKLIKPLGGDCPSRGGLPLEVVLLYQLLEAFPQLGVPHRLPVHLLLELLVGGNEEAAVVGRLVQDVQLGRLVDVHQGGHAVLQLVVVVLKVHPPLALHPVVEVPDLTALVFRGTSFATTATAVTGLVTA